MNKKARTRKPNVYYKLCNMSTYIEALARRLNSLEGPVWKAKFLWEIVRTASMLLINYRGSKCKKLPNHVKGVGS
jgi:hypothetical protein